MKKAATSVVLACANLVLFGLGYLDDNCISLYRHLPQAISILPLVVAFVVIPLLFLATLGFAIRDLFRSGLSWHAIVAIVLCVPIGIVYSRPW